MVERYPCALHETKCPLINLASCSFALRLYHFYLFIFFTQWPISVVFIIVSPASYPSRCDFMLDQESKKSKAEKRSTSSRLLQETLGVRLSIAYCRFVRIYSFVERCEMVFRWSKVAHLIGGWFDLTLDVESGSSPDLPWQLTANTPCRYSLLSCALLVLVLASLDFPVAYASERCKSSFLFLAYTH